MSDNPETVAASQRSILELLYTSASELVHDEHVSLPATAVALLALVDSPDIDPAQLNTEQKAALFAFATEYFPQLILADFGFSRDQ